MVECKLSEIIRFAHDLALFSSFLQGIIQTNLSSTLAANAGFAPFGIAQTNLTMHTLFLLPFGRDRWLAKFKNVDSQKVKRVVDVRWF